MLGGEGSFLVGSGGIGRGRGVILLLCVSHTETSYFRMFLKFELNWGTPGRIEMVHTILFS